MDFASHLLALEKYFSKHGELPSFGCWDLVLNCDPQELSEIINGLVERKMLLVSNNLPQLTKPPMTVYAHAPLRFNEAPIYSTAIPAGKPINFNEIPTETLNLHAFLIGKPEQTIILPISGESMIEAGINDGDLGIIALGNEASPGDIVAAEIDGELTLKRLIVSADGQLILHSENSNFADMRPAESLRIQGKLIGIARKY